MFVRENLSYMWFKNSEKYAMLFHVLLSVEQCRFHVSVVYSTGIHRNSLVTVSQLWLQGAMMSIAFKEGLKIPPPAMQEIILAANQDIRQVSTHSASVTIEIADYVH